MMSDGLAYRHDYHEQPPRVEYGLTELGTKMLPIVNSLADFGNYYKSIMRRVLGFSERIPPGNFWRSRCVVLLRRKW